MEKTVLKFNEYVNEDLNLTQFDNGVCRLSERWFFYNPDDDIIYGSNEKPILDDDVLFAFNPISCTILLAGEEQNYDVNNPICLIHYDLNNDEVFVYTDNALEFLQVELDFPGQDITSTRSRHRLEYIFQNQENDKFILIYGDQLIASTFDVIEEN